MKQMLEMTAALQAKLEGGRGDMQRSMGIQMEQYKAELSQLNE